MWRTRLLCMYLPKVKQRDPNEHPMKVQNAQSFMRTAAVMAALTVIASVFLGLRQTQKRNRLSQKELLRRRRGRRVVIVGGGAGGAAVAAVMANAAPNLEITVLEKDRQQTFMGHVALAHVGHRSYDIGTTTGVDLARSPATWNVTRDANLVAAEVLRVDPEAKKVFVRTTKSMLAVAAAPRANTEYGEGAAGEQPPQQQHQPGRGSAWVSGVLRRCWWRSSGAAPEVISVNDDGSPNMSDGTTVYAYDALVLAAGAQRSLGGLARQLRDDQLDTYRITVNPGATRDNLANLYAGTVLHVKVPPASFTAQLEAARALLRSPQGGVGVPTVELGPDASPLLVPAAASATSSALPALASLRARAAAWMGVSPAPTPPAADAADDGATRIPDEVAARLQRTTVAPLYGLAAWCMHYSSRQHDSTFVSSVNTIWKYLAYYSKLSLCHYVPVTADTEPIGPAPADVNGIIEAFWRGRQLSCQQRSGSGDTSGSVHVTDRFHPLFHSYITSLDTVASVATLYDYKNDAEVRVPYHLLLLDLPLVAPAFVRESGLHRTRYVEECVMPALRRAAAEPDAAVALRRHPLLGKSAAQLAEMFADEASFADVDPFTLQHRRYPDVFAIGDVAGLPSLKSYGAVTTQVPVVAHNVRQVLAQQDAVAAAVAEGGASDSSMPPSALPAVNARYTGYSSFHVIMTTWRAMWPEVCYDLPQPTLKCVDAPPTDASLAEAKRRLDVVAPLPRCDHHIWNSLAWRDARGFLNGLFYEAALYEVAYFFVFSRGLWHASSWFYVPVYSPVDGSPQLPTWRDLL